MAREFSLSVGGDQGILFGGFDGRGDFNLRFTDMPAILLEPLFASNPRQAEWIRSDDGQTRLARILYDSIRRFFQGGRLIGFSVGHKYKRSASANRGAAVVGGGWEAGYAEQVLLKAQALLEEVLEPQRERVVQVVAGEAVLFRQVIDVDADVIWDGMRGVLRIDRLIPTVAPRGVPRWAAGRPDAKTGSRTKRSKPLRARRPPSGN